MALTKEIKEYIHRSVLCWLATTSTENIPNVSPKEAFTYYGANIIIANIASPQTVQNIKQNENVSLSFIDVLVQKGFQIKGKAEVIGKTHSEFTEMEKILSEMTRGKFQFATITKIDIRQVKPIIAPSYILYPETTENDQIESSKRAYGIKKLTHNKKYSAFGR